MKLLISSTRSFHAFNCFQPNIFLLLFSLFVFIKPFHEHAIIAVFIIANIQNKEL
jgi:hypothetical protein